MNSVRTVLISCICIVLRFGANVRCDKHTYGGYKPSEALYEKYLLVKNTTKPTNYTIDFRFSGFTDITFVEVDVNCNSTAAIDVTRRSGYFGDDKVSAQINVTNCKNVSVFLGMYGYSIGGLTFLGDLTAIENTLRPKISTTIYFDQKKSNPFVSWGRRQLDDRLLEYRRIIPKDTEIPTNYSICSKYSFQNAGEIITYVAIEMKNNFTGSIDFNSTNNAISAILDVTNALDASVTLKVFGIVSRPRMDFDEDLLDPDLFKTQLARPKSFTIFYAQNKTKTTTTTNNKSSSFGQRRRNDRLLNVQTKLVNKVNRFARDDFVYEDNSKLITKFEFSFDSPTAIALINSSFVNEHGIEAVVYDLNRPSFRAKFSVYGYDRWIDGAPSNYKPIIFNDIF